MDSVNLSKSDLKRLFALSSAVPLLSFVLGICVANIASDTDTISTSAAPDDDVYGLQVQSHSQIENQNFVASSATAIPHPVGDAISTPMIKRYIVQAGLFSSEENAKKLSLSLERKNLSTQIVSETRNDTSLFRVIVGSFASEDNAKALSESIEKSYSIRLYVADTDTFQLNDMVAAL